MNLSRNLSGLVAVAVIAALTSGAFAAASVTVISNSAAVPTLDASGSIVRAYNLGDSTNINGSDPSQSSVHQTITFQDMEISGNESDPLGTAANSGTLNLSALTGDVGGVQIVTTTTGPHFGSTSGTLAPDPLFGSFIFSNATDQEVNISGLNAANDYKIQFGFGDARTQSFLDFSFDIFLDGVDSGQDITWNLADDGSSDIYALATVNVSGQSTLDFNLVANINSIGPGYSAIVVTDLGPGSVIPTPAALPAGLALIGLVAARRRRRC